MSRCNPPAGLFVALFLLTACDKPQPALLASGMDGMTSAARGVYDDDRTQAANLSDLLILTDTGFRAELARRMGTALASTQGQAETNGPLAGFGTANLLCPQNNTTQICTIFFGVRPLTNVGLAQGVPPMASGIIRFDAPYTDDVPPTDIPFQVAGAVSLGGLLTVGTNDSSATYRCRTDSVTSAGVKRHICSIRWGLVKITFAHDVLGTPSSEEGADLDELMDDLAAMDKLQKAGPTYLSIVAHTDPQIWRTLALRSEASRGQTLNAGETTVWALATTQSDWNIACQEAARRHQPIVIYSLEDVHDAYAALADSPVTRLADKAVLVGTIGQMSASDPWARAFNRAIGVHNAAMITVTGIPVMAQSDCRVTRAYQAPAGFIDVNTVQRAIAAQ